MIVVFAADAAYSSAHPNTGKGITDYGEETVEYQQVRRIGEAGTGCQQPWDFGEKESAVRRAGSKRRAGGSV